MTTANLFAEYSGRTGVGYKIVMAASRSQLHRYHGAHFTQYNHNTVRDESNNVLWDRKPITLKFS